MVKMMYVCFTLGAICLGGMLYYLGHSRQPGIYPPKKQLQQRASMFGLAGAVLLLIGFIIYLF
ncbi:hypothetical protein ELQ35_06290 [Peribacillus cavernae]|uniref:Uncharacterized protein n=1 Tax=Peribacillus cavernae TaxID=1674310 RepID=A0A3S1B7J6_9BACI|nr:hypothetical protein [Peribacillus cavernae]MDQ0217607.1 hypothetical protein [Peribacillus cavernae]RUQ29963.1 hypothetical protein ELQ35_06290 [Peribacillus cavernae]